MLHNTENKAHPTECNCSAYCRRHYKHSTDGLKRKVANKASMKRRMVDLSLSLTHVHTHAEGSNQFEQKKRHYCHLILVVFP